jgi:hypothetical protein
MPNQGVIASFVVDTTDLNITGNSSKSSFTFSLDHTVNLPRDNYEICLARCYLYYAWPNHPQLFPPEESFTWDGVPYALPKGTYSIGIVEAEVHLLTGVGNLEFNMNYKYATGKITICVGAGHTFVVTGTDLSKLIGFAVGSTIIGASCATGKFNPDFSGGVSSMYITNSLVQSCANYNNTKVLQYIYASGIPYLRPFSRYNVVQDTEQDFIWMDMNTNSITDMTLGIVDQNNIPLDMNGYDTQFWFLIRRKDDNIVRVTTSDMPVRPI